MEHYNCTHTNIEPPINRKLKNTLVILCCLIGTINNAQVWDKSDILDSTINELGQVSFIRNSSNLDEKYFDYDSEGNLVRTTINTTKNGIQYEIITDYFSTGAVKRESYLYILDKKFYGQPQLDFTKEYYENGNMKTIRFYVEGKETGTTVNYYQNGAIDSEMDFANSRLMNIRNFDDKGTELDIGDFKDGSGDRVIYENGVQVAICRYKEGKLIKRSCRCD